MRLARKGRKMERKKMIAEMENDKNELISIIKSLTHPKAVKYLLGFTKSFIELRK